MLLTSNRRSSLDHQAIFDLPNGLSPVFCPSVHAASRATQRERGAALAAAAAQGQAPVWLPRAGPF